MTTDESTLSRGSLATLAVEIWRACREAERVKEGAIGLRYALRKIRSTLEESGIAYIDATGQLYDSGMAFDVVDIEGEEMEGAELFIKETMTPIILLNGTLLSWGEVVLERRQAPQPTNS